MKIDSVNFNFIFYKFDWMSHFASPTICLLLFYLHVSTFCFSFLFLRFSIDVSTFSFLSVQFNNSDDTKTFLPQQVVQQNYFSRPKTNIFEKLSKLWRAFLSKTEFHTDFLSSRLNEIQYGNMCYKDNYLLSTIKKFKKCKFYSCNDPTKTELLSISLIKNKAKRWIPGLIMITL